MDLKGKKVLVVGLGVTGISLVKLLVRMGAVVTATDAAPPEKLTGAVNALREYPIPLDLGGHREETFLKHDLIVISPGVLHDLPVLQMARASGARVMGELDLASQFIKVPVIAVTGTNGKTTVTTLIGEMMKTAGIPAFVGGNIGVPVSEYLLASKGEEVLVLEVSSFQLDTLQYFRPDVGVLLNVSDDHLDRYPNFEKYLASKARVFAFQKKGDVAILNMDDPPCRSLAGKVPSRLVPYSLKESFQNGGMPGEGGWVTRWPEGEHIYSWKNFKLPGHHNLENALAAILAAEAVSVPGVAIQKTLDHFAGLPHRIQFVREIQGVRFYDDSKATNVGAVVRALEGFKTPVHLIAGGLDKMGSYAPLEAPVQKKVKTLILIGEAREKIRSALGNLSETLEARDMEEAVRLAVSRARPGEVVLLSPACASFDMFESYVHRGRVFQDAVQKLG